MKKILLFFFLIIGICVWAECPVIPVEVPKPSEQAIRFSQSGNLLWIIRQVLKLALPALIVFTGFSAKLRSLAHAIGKNAFFTFVVFLIFYSILITVITFPLSYYSDYIRLHDYGLSTQTFSRFFKHYLMSFCIDTLSSLFIFGILYFLIAKSPKKWWFYSTLVMIPVTVFFVIVQPIWVAPLFNKFGPMKNKEIEQKILNLAERAGIKDSRVYEVDKSADTKAVNAYVTGIGSASRIVLWDTTINKLDEDELLFVMGHEMGHYVLHHIAWSIAFNTGFSLLIFYLIHVTSRFCILRFSKKMGFTQLKDVASLPLVLLLYSFYSLLFAPLSNAFSRYHEHEADRFGLEITQDNHAAATGMIKLAYNNLSVPYPKPWVVWFRGTHPSIGSRVDFFNNYHPWCDREASRYQKYFKNDTE